MEFSRSGLSDNPWATSRTMIAIIIGRVGVIREKANRQQKTAASSSFFFLRSAVQKKKKKETEGPSWRHDSNQSHRYLEQYRHLLHRRGMAIREPP